MPLVDEGVMEDVFFAIDHNTGLSSLLEPLG